MVDTANPEWIADCRHWRGRVLTGRAAHWCFAWDGLPIDETTPEWPCECAGEILHGLVSDRTKVIADRFVGRQFNDATREDMLAAFKTDTELNALLDLAVAGEEGAHMTIAMDWAEFEQKLLMRNIPSKVERAELRGAFYAGAARVLRAFKEPIEAEDGPGVTATLEALQAEIDHYIEGLNNGAPM